jgi:predicted PurR-regulated permease PerM
VIVLLIGVGLLFVIDLIWRPMIIGSKAKIHPLVAFLAALGGLSVLGFYGLFLGPIIVGLLVNLINEG